MIFAMARGAFWARLTPTTSCPDLYIKDKTAATMLVDETKKGKRS